LQKLPQVLTEVEVEKLREAVERAPLANRTQRENDMFGLIE
jgi:hypothetical protein